VYAGWTIKVRREQITNLRTEIAQQEKNMIADRRYLHQHPELSNKEKATTDFLKRRLQEFGIKIEALQLATGLSALVLGAKPGKTICIRHDIDALPIKEETKLPFASLAPGISHACGHDIHAITALYAAKILQAHREQLCGNVRIVFQPAEENGTGALRMIKAGLMELAPKNDIVIGLHTHPQTTVGNICLRSGPMEAGNDTVKITIKGKSGHGAYPHRCVDPIITSAFLLSELQAVVARNNEAVKPAVLTFGSIHGGTAANVIPEQVEIAGTLRTFYKDSRKHALEAIKRITNGVCASMGAVGTVDTSGMSLSPIFNDAEVTKKLIVAADKALGSGHVVNMELPSPGSDDFGIFMDYCKGAQFFLGTGNAEPDSRSGLHTSTNIFDERSMNIGVAVLVQFVLDYLK